MCHSERSEESYKAECATGGGRINFDQQMLDVIAGLDPLDPPRLLLHSCCAPCSSSVLEQLSRHFRVTVLYYNPNIYPREEYTFRKEEQKRFIAAYPFANPVDFLDCEYEPAQFYEAAKGLEREPERGSRCTVCYRLRLSRAAREAAAGGYDYFATTLTLSPMKDAARLNQIGREEAALLRENMGEKAPLYLPSDFKKRNGYLRSIEISKACGMYRQEYCGCEFSI